MKFFCRFGLFLITALFIAHPAMASIERTHSCPALPLPRTTSGGISKHDHKPGFFKKLQMLRAFRKAAKHAGAYEPDEKANPWAIFGLVLNLLGYIGTLIVVIVNSEVLIPLFFVSFFLVLLGTICASIIRRKQPNAKTRRVVGIAYWMGLAYLYPIVFGFILLMLISIVILSAMNGH